MYSLPDNELTILFVDDEEVILKAACAILKQFSMKVLPFTSPATVLKYLNFNSLTKINCAVIDSCLPEMSGQELYRNISQKFPNLPVIFTSGFDIELSQNIQKNEKALFLLKPFRFEKLICSIEQLIKGTHAEKNS